MIGEPHPNTRSFILRTAATTHWRHDLSQHREASRQNDAAEPCGSRGAAGAAVIMHTVAPDCFSSSFHDCGLAHA